MSRTYITDETPRTLTRTHKLKLTYMHTHAGLLGSSRQAKAPRKSAPSYWLVEFEHGDAHEVYHS